MKMNFAVRANKYRLIELIVPIKMLVKLLSLLYYEFYAKYITLIKYIQYHNTFILFCYLNAKQWLIALFTVSHLSFI